jgi:hypothetical protein
MVDSEGKINIINHHGQIITIPLDEIETTNHEGRIVTIKPHDEASIDLRTSCNKAVGVPKLLG